MIGSSLKLKMLNLNSALWEILNKKIRKYQWTTTVEHFPKKMVQIGIHFLLYLHRYQYCHVRVYFGNRGKTGISIIKNHSMVFQNIYHNYLYTFACVWTNCLSIFAIFDWGFSKICIMNAAIASSVGKTLAFQFVFDVREWKRCQIRTIWWMTNQINVLDAENHSCLIRCVRLRIVVL